MTKKCSGKCKEILQISSFNKNKSKKDGYNTICRECSKARSREYYAENREKHCKAVSVRKAGVIEENKLKLKAVKEKHGCCNCPEDVPACLDFHHKDPDMKLHNVSSMINETYCWATIKIEIDKCLVICANCHRKYHAGLISL